MADPNRTEVYDRIGDVYHGDLTITEATDAVMALLAEAPSPYTTTVRDEAEARESVLFQRAETAERLAEAVVEAREVARGEAVVLRERLAHLEAELARGGIAREKMRQQLADAKRAAEAPQPRVLWRGETYFLGSREDPRLDRSWMVPPYPFAVDGPPGTKVALVVIEDTETPALCQALGCPNEVLTTFTDGAGKDLDLCEDHGDLLAVGFALKAPLTHTARCTTCGGRGLVSLSGRGSDGPDPCPECGPGAVQTIPGLLAQLDESLAAAEAARDRHVASRLTEEDGTDG